MSGYFARLAQRSGVAAAPAAPRPDGAVVAPLEQIVEIAAPPPGPPTATPAPARSPAPAVVARRPERRDDAPRRLPPDPSPPGLARPDPAPPGPSQPAAAPADPAMPLAAPTSPAPPTGVEAAASVARALPASPTRRPAPVP